MGGTLILLATPLSALDQSFLRTIAKTRKPISKSRCEICALPKHQGHNCAKWQFNVANLGSRKRINLEERNCGRDSLTTNTGKNKQKIDKLIERLKSN
ncbi:hypothetical protein [Prochlorococcus marinus]|uniref:hypothetical protein n=1 Tax=Prochlorococcus marinus TaxID=1219 RepID=UPI001F157BFA|nr:hypothetical protein [Prochlorococcus marinus]